jgi:predicted glycoside hydrolase/deacetylase ChbG (UPF0249 family)
MMRLIINADDLGYSDLVNDSIFSLIAQGRVTSATMIMNAPAVESAARQVGCYPQASFGIHLNITEFAPLSNHSGLSPLLHPDRREFSGLARKIKLDKGVQDGVVAEWSAQVERALALGVPVSHLDSHHHVHTEPRLFFALKQVQKKFGIGKIRLTRNIFGPAERQSQLRRGAKWVWNEALRRCHRTTTTDYFTEFETFYLRLKSRQSWRGDIELMCHPGGPGYARETALLDGSWRQELAPDAVLINYNML